jgi:hypothetical protein
MTRQEFLDNLKVGDEVSVDYRASGRGCKTFKLQELIRTKKYDRAFLVHGMRFSPTGGLILDDDTEMWPSSCCLEDPDSDNLGWGPQPKRRDVSRRLRALRFFASLDKKSLTTDELVAMIRVKFPDYVPDWNVR